MKDDVKIIRFTGWHGTDEKNADQILKDSFRESRGNKHWLGEGVYFFTDGVGDPSGHAQNWAKSEARKRNSARFAVLKAGIAVNDDTILDLRENKGLELFNAHKSYILREIRSVHRGFRVRSKAYCDSKVIEHMKQAASLEVVVMNMYVQFLKDRIENIRSRIPNCTFLCVSNPDENINHDTVEIVNRGNI